MGHALQGPMQSAEGDCVVLQVRSEVQRDTVAASTVFDLITASRARAVVLLVFIALFAFLPGLTAMPPVDRDEARYAQAAERTVALFYPGMQDYPAGYAAMAVALSERLSPPKLLVLRGRQPELGRWQRELARTYLPDGLVLALPEDLAGLPATLDKPRRAEPVNGWLCRGVTCLAPISDLIQLQTACKEKT